MLRRKRMIAACGYPRGAAAWFPTSKSGLQLWVENDPATVFTDAGTTLASDGQAIQQLNDKSGLGRYMTQSTVAFQPTWHTAEGGYLAFAGSSQKLALASTVNPNDASGQHVIAVKCRASALGAVMDACYINITSSLGVDATGNVSATATSTGSTTTTNTGAAVSAGSWVQLIATITTTQLQSFLNAAGDTPSALSGTRRNSSVQINLGGGSNSWVGDIKFLAIWSGTASGGDITSINSYMSGR